MPKFVKKLLARYVIYLEIIGYVFVILFIAGLVALSYIKAEDEYVTLNGKFEIESFFIQMDKRHYIVDILADTNAHVPVKAALMEVTDDEKFIADQLILHNLEQQVVEAQTAAQHQLAKQLTSIIYDIEARTYPHLSITTIRTPIAGDYILLNPDHDLIQPGKFIGGVLDFYHSHCRVSEFPADKKLKKKLKLHQTGTATLITGLKENIALPVSVQQLEDNEIILNMSAISSKQKKIIAKFFSVNPDKKNIDATISILVGWRSWMNLIWR